MINTDKYASLVEIAGRTGLTLALLQKDHQIEMDIETPGFHNLDGIGRVIDRDLAEQFVELFKEGDA